MDQGGANFKTSGKETGEAEGGGGIGGAHLSVCVENEVKKKSSGERKNEEEADAGSVNTPYVKKSDYSCIVTSEDQHEKNQRSCDGRLHPPREKEQVKEKERERVSCCEEQRETSFPTDGSKENQKKDRQHMSLIGKQGKPQHGVPSSSYPAERNTHGEIIISANTTSSSSSSSSPSASVSVDDVVDDGFPSFLYPPDHCYCC